MSSIAPQSDARGVVHHGLTRWNSTEPATIRIRAIAMAMLGFRPCVCSGASPQLPTPLEPPIQPGRGHAENNVLEQHRAAAQVREPREVANHPVEIEQVQRDAEQPADE